MEFFEKIPTTACDWFRTNMSLTLKMVLGDSIPSFSSTTNITYRLFHALDQAQCNPLDQNVRFIPHIYGADHT